MMNDTLPALSLRNINKSYLHSDGSRQEVLRGLNLAIRPGETVALMAPSGTGKTTLLNIAGLLDQADSGDVLVAGHEATPADIKLRAHTIGFVFQFHYLMKEFTVLENVLMPFHNADGESSKGKARALELLETFGLSDRIYHKPGQLSGGEQQRVAICRALINKPKLLIADEPTGNLDPENSAKVVDILTSLASKTDMAVLMATHNPEIAGRFDRIVRLQ